MNSKIELKDSTYKWKKFPGFSLLFYAGDKNFNGNMLFNNLPQANSFYQILHKVFTDYASENPLLSDDSKFLNLDFPSWHVTVWDGINQANFSQLQREDLTYFSRFMNSLKYSDIHPDIRTLVEKSIRWMNSTGEIRFAFRKLYNYENKVMVVSLKPADISSLEKLHKIKLIRRNLNNYFEDHFGFATSKRYLPHTSLGYFVDEQAGEDFEPYHEELNSLLEKKLTNSKIAFNSVGLFGFTDMVSFFKY